MAARRLIAVMLVLLFLSSLAAALAPVERQDPTTSTSEAEPDTDVEETGRLLRRTIAASRTEPESVHVQVGDQLQLRVTVKRPTTLELAGLGPTADADPLAPARFDVLLNLPGSFAVRELESRKRVGLIRVSPRRPAPTEPGAAAADGRS